jgi:hypothetical protein
MLMISDIIVTLASKNHLKINKLWKLENQLLTF